MPYYHQFAGIYESLFQSFTVTGTYYYLPVATGSSLAEFCTLVVYFNYSSQQTKGIKGVDQCVHISISSDGARVKNFAGVEKYNSPFYEWLKELVAEDFRLRENQHGTGISAMDVDGKE